MTFVQQTVTLGARAESSQVLGLPNRIYHAEKDRQSCSMLKHLLVSPAHYRNQFFTSSPRSAALDFGTLIHTLVLQPHLFHLEYAIWPEDIRPTSRDGKHFAALHKGKSLLTEIELRQARQLTDQILHRPFRGRAFGRYFEEGRPEATLFYTDPDVGVPCRVRPDLWHPEFIFDLKTTRHAQSKRFGHAAVDLHYDLQAYMYSYADSLYAGRDALLPFVFISAENTAPFSVSALTAGPSFMENGQEKYVRALTSYAGCAQVDYWPDSGVEEEIEIEPWQMAGDSRLLWSAGNLGTTDGATKEAA